MRKAVIIINGNGGVGKDTLCEFAGAAYRTQNISSVTPIKEIASRYGWRGEKDSRSRRFLADLKRVFSEYNDLPCRYLEEEYRKFLESDAQLLFVHIREGEEIDKFKRHVDIPCITLLIRRGNASDDNVEKYAYDYCYDNDRELTEAKDDFVRFLQDILGF